MNLDLPFYAPEASELDEYLARLDRELDALFLEEVNETVELLRAGRPAAEAAA